MSTTKKKAQSRYRSLDKLKVKKDNYNLTQESKFKSSILTKFKLKLKK